MWSLLSNHGRALLCLAEDPEMRLRDLGERLGITERRAFDLVNDLAVAGYVIKEKDGRRNRYHVQDHLPLPEAPGDRTLCDILAALL
jgi:DNA-binding MarR family transcriptional regulator